MTGSARPQGLKDDELARLADRYNTAQFVSFAPGDPPRPRHVRVRDASGHPPTSGPNSTPDAIEGAIESVLRCSAGRVNVRSFRPGSPAGNPFHYGVSGAADAAGMVRKLAAEGYHTIVNELVDVDDGGVSGVALGELVEFAPQATPRAVEGPDAAALPRELADRLLATVYGFAPRIPPSIGRRIEFSIHPLRVGLRREHTIVWEAGQDPGTIRPLIRWPNKFSRFVGDKAYGLLIADAAGLPVPATTVIGRNVAPFRLGQPTGTHETWLRTCPAEQVAGKYTTHRGWIDPYALLQSEDPAGAVLVSVLAQESVPAAYSGASRPVADGPDLVEGVAGHGDRFMLGAQGPDDALPASVVADVRAMTALARQLLGPVRTEWAHDGRQAWLLQLHVVSDVSAHGVLSDGDPPGGWVEFDPREGLAALRAFIERSRGGGLGVTLTRPVGYTSHVADLLRRAGVPGRFRAG